MKQTQTTIEKELVEAIKSFEEIHKKYLNSDGSLNESGWQLCHVSEVEWDNDPKWNDYVLYHLRPRIEQYWYNEVEDDWEGDDKNYRKHWTVLHPKLAKELWN